MSAAGSSNGSAARADELDADYGVATARFYDAAYDRSAQLDGASRRPVRTPRRAHARILPFMPTFHERASGSGE